MNHGFFLLFGLFVVGVIVFAVFAWMGERKRKEALRALAAKRGWGFIEKDRHERPHMYQDFEPFGQGHSRYAFNIITGQQDDFPFELFDYHYAVTRSSGKSQRTEHHYFQMATLQMPIRSPGLSIKDEHIGHKIFDALGGEDIDFESAEFSKRFWVRGSDRRFVYDIVHPRMMEFLMDHKGWVWQWREDTLLVHRTGRLSPEAIDPMLDLAFRFRKMMPRHRIATVQ